MEWFSPYTLAFDKKQSTEWQQAGVEQDTVVITIRSIWDYVWCVMNVLQELVCFFSTFFSP